MNFEPRDKGTALRIIRHLSQQHSFRLAVNTLYYTDKSQWLRCRSSLPRARLASERPRSANSVSFSSLPSLPSSQLLFLKSTKRTYNTTWPRPMVYWLTLYLRHSFTFGLLYSLILTSITTTFLIRKEQVRAANGTLGKDKYVKYQLFKIFAAAGLYVVGFVAFLASSGGNDTRKPGEQGLWIGGVKVNKWQGMILWIHFFNWYVVSLFDWCVSMK